MLGHQTGFPGHQLGFSGQYQPHSTVTVSSVRTVNGTADKRDITSVNKTRVPSSFAEISQHADLLCQLLHTKTMTNQVKPLQAERPTALVVNINSTWPPLSDSDNQLIAEQPKQPHTLYNNTVTLPHRCFNGDSFKSVTNGELRHTEPILTLSQPVLIEDKDTIMPQSVMLPVDVDLGLQSDCVAHSNVVESLISAPSSSLSSTSSGISSSEPPFIAGQSVAPLESISCQLFPIPHHILIPQYSITTNSNIGLTTGTPQSVRTVTNEREDDSRFVGICIQ